jgi:hypothetical protein
MKIWASAFAWTGKCAEAYLLLAQVRALDCYMRS